MATWLKRLKYTKKQEAKMKIKTNKYNGENYVKCKQQKN